MPQLPPTATPWNRSGVLDTDLAALFAAAVTIAFPGRGDRLAPEEYEAVANAVPARRAEFLAGRSAARSGLAREGAPVSGLPVRPDRSPAWPPGMVGSIAHCTGFCAAVVGRRARVAGLGLDAEEAIPLPADLLGLVMTAEETASVQSRPPPPGAGWGKLAFCAKEAFYKAYFPLTAQALSFHDVRLRFLEGAACDRGGFAAAILDPSKAAAGAPERFVGRWRLVSGHLLAAVTVLV